MDIGYHPSLAWVSRSVGGGARVVFPRPVEHVGAIRGQGDLGERPGEAASGLDECDHRAGGVVETLERARPEQADLAGEPVITGEQLLGGGDGVGFADGLEHPRAELGLVESQVEHGVVELADEGQDPCAGPGGDELVGRRRLSAARTGDGEHGRSEPTVELDVQVGILDRVALGGSLDGRELDPRGAVGTVRGGGPGGRPFGDQVVEGAARRGGVDQAPRHRLGGLEPFGAGGEDVGEIAADVTLVDEPCQPSGAGQHGEQRHLGERHGGRPIVDHDDLVAGEGELVATAGRGAVDGGDPRLPGVGRGVLDAVARLVGELAEVDLVGVRRAGEHLDVGPRGEHVVDPAGYHDRLDVGMLEPQSLDDVVELDVDAEIVGVELELVSSRRPASGVTVRRSVATGGSSASCQCR